MSFRFGSPGNAPYTGRAPNGLILPALLCTFTALFRLAGGASASTNVSGNQSGTWTPAGSPYIVTGALSVPAAQTLTIQAGVLVRVQPAVTFHVLGALVTQGTPVQPVVFTSNAASPAPGNWYGIATTNGCTLDLSYTELYYGGLGGFPEIYVAGRAALVSWVGGGAFQSASAGASVQSTTTTLSNLTFGANATDGIIIDSTHPPTLSAIACTGNGQYGIRVNANPGNFPNTLSGSGNGYNGIYVTGNLGGTEPAGTWAWGANPGFPYICGTHTVPAGQILQLAAGVIVKMLDSKSITINGSLQTLGTAPSPVVLTSLTDDTQGGNSNAADGAVSPARGLWFGIATGTNAVLDLAQTSIYYGGRGNLSNIYPVGRAASITWDGGGTVGSANHGLSLQSTTTNLANLAVNGNAANGLVIDSTHPATLSQISCSNNGQYAIVISNNPGSYPPTLSGAGNGFNGIYLTGNVGGTEAAATWTWGANPLFPYILGTPIVPSGVTLNIAAGSVLKKLIAGQMTVNGTLNCQGSSAAPGPPGTRGAYAPEGAAADAPVWFTSLKDDAHGGDTNGDGAATSPAPADWLGIRANAGSTLTLNQTWFAYSGNGGLAPLYGTMNSLQWTGGGTINNAASGATVNAAALTIDGIRAQGNAAWGLVLQSTGAAAISGCDISNNTTGGLSNSLTTSLIDARNNWWGDATGPLDPTNGNPDFNPGGLGNKVSDYVQYRPFLTAPVLSTPPGNFALLNPLQGVTIPVTPVQFHWSAAIDPDGDALTYDLQVDDDPLFGSPAITANGLSGLTYSSSGLLASGVTYYWCVVARDGHGGECLCTPGTGVFTTVPAVSGVNTGIANVLAVGFASPNPMSASSVVHFNLPVAGPVRADVFDVSGRLVRRLIDSPLEAGPHDADWDGRGSDGGPVAGGVYYYRVSTPSGSEMRRVVVTR